MLGSRFPDTTTTIEMSKHKLEDSSSLKHDKKRRKKDRKEALKYEDITPSSTEVTSTEGTPAPGDDDEASGKYKQNSGLSALPQSDIDSYLSTENVQITDPTSSSLRPILQFSHLPSEILTLFSSFLSQYKTPSSIQSSAWPFLLSQRDVVGIAETGSGKTLAFGLPLVHRLSHLLEIAPADGAGR